MTTSNFIKSPIRNNATAPRIVRFADAKRDLPFKMLFGKERNKDLLINFLNSILPEKNIKNIIFLPTILDHEISSKKLSIVDVLCTDDHGSQYIIEMQNDVEKGFEKRATFDASKAYSDQNLKGGKYINLKEIIFIAITNYVMFPESKKYLSCHKIQNVFSGANNFKDLTFIILELPKYTKKKPTNAIDEWCDFFKNANSRVEVKTRNSVIKKAYKVLDIANWSEPQFRGYQAAEKMRHDTEAILDYARDEGKKEGKKEGKNEGKREVAMKLKEKGMASEEIANLIDLPLEEIKFLL